MVEIADFMKAFDEGKGFDFIREHYYEMRREDLGRIASELIYAIEGAGLMKTDIKAIKSIVHYNLDD